MDGLLVRLRDWKPMATACCTSTEYLCCFSLVQPAVRGLQGSKAYPTPVQVYSGSAASTPTIDGARWNTAHERARENEKISVPSGRNDDFVANCHMRSIV